MEILDVAAVVPVWWLCVFIIMLAIEVVTLGLTTIWFAGGALVAGILSLFNAPILLQIGAFIVISAVLMIFTRPIAVRYFNDKRVRTNAESLIGERATVTITVDNAGETGEAVIGGMVWSARSYVSDEVIPEGTRVEVMDIRGVKLIVKPVVKKETAEKED